MGAVSGLLYPRRKSHLDRLLMGTTDCHRRQKPRILHLNFFCVPKYPDPSNGHHSCFEVSKPEHPKRSFAILKIINPKNWGSNLEANARERCCYFKKEAGSAFCTGVMKILMCGRVNGWVGGRAGACMGGKQTDMSGYPLCEVRVKKNRYQRGDASLTPHVIDWAKIGPNSPERYYPHNVPPPLYGIPQGAF